MEQTQQKNTKPLEPQQAEAKAALLRSATDEHDPVKYDASHLHEHFEALVPFGYENDYGGFGDVVLNVDARKLTVERNDRLEDYTTTTYEV